MRGSAVFLLYKARYHAKKTSMVTMMTVCLAGAFEPTAMALLRAPQGTLVFGLVSDSRAIGNGGGTRLANSLCCTGPQPLFRRFCIDIPTQDRFSFKEYGLRSVIGRKTKLLWS